MNTIPTAKEYLKNKGLSEVMSEADLIEFAEFHREAILKAAAEKAYLTETGCRDGRVTFENTGQVYFIPNFYGEDHEVEINKQSILNAYPKELIK